MTFNVNTITVNQNIRMVWWLVFCPDISAHDWVSNDENRLTSHFSKWDFFLVGNYIRVAFFPPTVGVTQPINRFRVFMMKFVHFSASPRLVCFWCREYFKFRSKTSSFNMLTPVAHGALLFLCVDVCLFLYVCLFRCCLSVCLAFCVSAFLLPSFFLRVSLPLFVSTFLSPFLLSPSLCVLVPLSLSVLLGSNPVRLTGR